MESVRRFWSCLPSSFPPDSHVRDLTPVELKNTKVVQDLHALYGGRCYTAVHGQSGQRNFSIESDLCRELRDLMKNLVRRGSRALCMMGFPGGVKEMFDSPEKLSGCFGCGDTE